jgi:hypothetical protein
MRTLKTEPGSGNVRRGLRRISVAGLALAGTTLCSRTSSACELTSAVSPAAMVREADAIVRTLALGYARPPTGPNSDPPLRFRVIEVIRGEVPPELELPGYPVDRDDFNEGSVPYAVVRRTGHMGSCYSNFYRPGAEFLLMLKKRGSGYTVEWYPMGPVNEQLRSPDDPWLAWVRKEAQQK